MENNNDDQLLNYFLSNEEGVSQGSTRDMTGADFLLSKGYTKEQIDKGSVQLNQDGAPIDLTKQLSELAGNGGILNLGVSLKVELG